MPTQSPPPKAAKAESKADCIKRRNEAMATRGFTPPPQPVANKKPKLPSAPPPQAIAASSLSWRNPAVDADTIRIREMLRVSLQEAPDDEGDLDHQQEVRHATDATNLRHNLPECAHLASPEDCAAQECRICNRTENIRTCALCTKGFCDNNHACVIGHWELCNGGCRKAKEDQDEADGCEAAQEYLHQRWKEEMRSTERSEEATTPPRCTECSAALIYCDELPEKYFCLCLVKLRDPLPDGRLLTHSLQQRISKLGRYPVD